MISTNRVLDELQRQLTNAKSASDEASIRESIAAMHSLCGLILASEGGTAHPLQTIPSFDETPTKPIAVTQQVQQPLEGKLLEEDDANGGSLFDF